MKFIISGIKRYPIIVAAAAVIAVLWLFAGLSGNDNDAGDVGDSHSKKPVAEVGNLIKVENLTAQHKPRRLLVNAVTEAIRELELKAEVAGRIVELPVKEGEYVEEGTVLLRIDPRERKESLRQAEALLAQRQIEYEAARSLKSKGFRSKIGMAAAKTNLEEARARLKQAQIEFDNTQIIAPFSGKLERFYVEIGDFVNSGAFSPNAAVALFVEDDPLLVTGYVAERDLAGLHPGISAKVRLGDDKEVTGVVTFVGSVADESTRSFRIEAETANPAHDIPVGITVDLQVPVGDYPAYRVPSSLLALDDAGKVGVKILNEDGVVKFLPVRIIDQDDDGIWITAMDASMGNSIRLITQGAAFVSVGQEIKERKMHKQADE